MDDAETFYDISEEAGEIQPSSRDITKKTATVIAYHELPDGGDGSPRAIDEDQDSDDSDSHDDVSTKSPSKRTRIRSLKNKSKAKTKGLLGMDKSDNSKSEEYQANDRSVSQDFDGEPAFNPSHVMSKKSPDIHGIATSPKKAMKSIGSAIAHPKDTIKSKITTSAAGKMSRAQRPFLSPEADREFLEAHDDLSRVTSTQASKQVSEDEGSAQEGWARHKVRSWKHIGRV